MSILRHPRLQNALPDVLNMLTGEELRRMREASGLMRKELADLLGLPVAVVKLAEAGRVGLVGRRRCWRRLFARLDDVPERAQDALYDLPSAADNIGAGVVVLAGLGLVCFRLSFARGNFELGMNRTVCAHGQDGFRELAVLSHGVGACAVPTWPSAIWPGCAGSGLTYRQTAEEGLGSTGTVAVMAMRMGARAVAL